MYICICIYICMYIYRERVCVCFFVAMKIIIPSPPHCRSPHDPGPRSTNSASDIPKKVS